jgi:glycosyltransferase involved in cell wall biosynthesis
LSKAYIPLVFRKTISATFERFENRICSKLSGIVTSTPFIKMRFSKINNAVTEVQNFPFIEEFSKDDSATVESPQDYVCYVGAISKVRGILNIVKAMAFVENAKLLLAGKFETEELRDNAIRTEGWDKVVELGFVDREEVKKTLQKSTAGLVVLEPTINYLDSIPIKMFEYMAAGIPVIASNFKYWKDLIKEENCALFVDPIDPDNIAEAISTLMKDKDRAKAMGENGRNAVLEKFNWSREEEKLLAFYGRLGN